MMALESSGGSTVGSKFPVMYRSLELLGDIAVQQLRTEMDEPGVADAMASWQKYAADKQYFNPETPLQDAIRAYATAQSWEQPWHELCRYAWPLERMAMLAEYPPEWNEERVPVTAPYAVRGKDQHPYPSAEELYALLGLQRVRDAAEVDYIDAMQYEADAGCPADARFELRRFNSGIPEIDLAELCATDGHGVMRIPPAAIAIRTAF